MVHKLIFIVVFPELGKKKAAAGRPDLGGLSYWLAGLLHPFWSLVLVVPYTPWKRAYIEETVP